VLGGDLQELLPLQYRLESAGIYLGLHESGGVARKSS